MNRADPSKTVLVAGFLISAVFHLSVWGIASGFVKIGKQSPEAVKKAAEQARNQPKPEPRIRLGLDESKAYTLTWLGFTEATEHAGPQTAIEQSAMTPKAGDPTPPAPQASPAPQLQPPPDPTTAITSAQVQEAAQAIAGVGRKLNEAMRTAVAKPAAPNPAPTNPAAAPTTAGNNGTPGLTADKEAMASAIKKAPKVVLGQVLASEGLDIQTKSPKWGMTTMQTRRPANPTVQITFGRDGKVIRAGFAKDGRVIYSTGYDDVDEPLLSAIYTWTARGKHLVELTSKDPSGEVTILITIILNG